jgi:phospholipase C
MSKLIAPAVGVLLSPLTGFCGLAEPAPTLPTPSAGVTHPGNGSTIAEAENVDTLAIVDAAAAQAACASPFLLDVQRAAREACTFGAGASARDTIGNTPALPLTHLVVVMQENRAFDHMLGRLSLAGQPDAEPLPADYRNPDAAGISIAPFHLGSTCLEADPPHQWTAMHAGWNDGRMDGFVQSAAVGDSNGHYAMGFYDETDLPFYYWLATTYAISDRYFGSALGGTWANRDYLYAGTSAGVMNTAQAVIDVPTIFDALESAGVAYGVYTDGRVRQDCIGWTNTHAGVGPFSAFLAALESGTLPPVAFVDPGPGQDEHPAADVQPGEAWARTIYDAALASPLWPGLAIIYTYDESGGLADHVAPPPACLASADQNAFDRLGVRVPVIAISPWARSHFVSHLTHEHASVLRLIELLHDLPALTGRDANSDALLDLFDFDGPPRLDPPPPPAAGTGGCP